MCKEHVLYNNYLKINAELFCSHRWNRIITFTFIRPSLIFFLPLINHFNIEYLFIIIQKYSVEKIIIEKLLLRYMYIFYFQILKLSKIFLRNIYTPIRMWFWKVENSYIIIGNSIGKEVTQTRIEISEQLDSKYISILLRRYIR